MLKILQKQYQLIKISTDSDIENKVAPWCYAIKYKNKDHVIDFLISKHRHYIDKWIKSTDTVPKDYKIISFKKFREIY